MAKYEATRFQDRGVVATVDGQPLDPRLDLYNHSPTGFEMGYSGSGPAQLSLAILAHHLRDGLKSRKVLELADLEAVHLHQYFKGAFVAKVEGDYFSIDTLAISDWLARIRLRIVQDAQNAS